MAGILKERAVDAFVFTHIYEIKSDLLQDAHARPVPIFHMGTKTARQQFSVWMFKIPVHQSSRNLRRETPAPLISPKGIRQFTTGIDLTEPSSTDHFSSAVGQTPLGPTLTSLFLEVPIEPRLRLCDALWPSAPNELHDLGVGVQCGEIMQVRRNPGRKFQSLGRQDRFAAYVRIFLLGSIRRAFIDVSPVGGSESALVSMGQRITDDNGSTPEDRIATVFDVIE